MGAPGRGGGSRPGKGLVAGEGAHGRASRVASPAGVAGSPRQSGHSAACGSASSPSPGAAGRGLGSQNPRAGARSHLQPQPPACPQNRQGNCGNGTDRGSSPVGSSPSHVPASPFPARKGGPVAQRPDPAGALEVQEPGPGCGKEGREETVARKPRAEGSGTGGRVLLDGGSSPGGPPSRALPQAGHRAAGYRATCLPKRQAQVGPDGPPAPGEPGSRSWGAHAQPQPARTTTHSPGASS